MSYLFGKLCDQGILWHWTNDVRSWFKAARNFVFTPDSNRTLIWHCLIGNFAPIWILEFVSSKSFRFVNVTWSLHLLKDTLNEWNSHGWWRKQRATNQTQFYNDLPISTAALHNVHFGCYDGPVVKSWNPKIHFLMGKKYFWGYFSYVVLGRKL